MPIDFGKLFSDTGKGISDFLEKTGNDITEAIDQNGDGQFGFDDIQMMADKIGAAQAEAQRKADLERLKPLFPEDIEQVDFSLPKMIRIAKIDKDHAQSKACEGSIGFRTELDGMTAITVFSNHVNAFNLSFYPALDDAVYYVDPSDRDHYIALDDYFAYMKVARVAELQRIAQSLGAKHFRITYKERKSSSSSRSLDASIQAAASTKNKANTGINHLDSNASISAISVEAEMDFPGHDPVQPVVQYLKKDINVANLIAMRMDPTSPLQHQRFNIELSSSLGIKEKDAAKIDAMCKLLKATISAKIAVEVHEEARKVLEYEIDF